MQDKDYARWLNSDALFACLIPFVLFSLGLQLIGRPELSLGTILEIIRGRKESKDAMSSLQRAIFSFDQYPRLALEEIALMRQSYGRLSWAHKRIGYDVGYPAKLNRLADVTLVNARVAEGIASLARQEFPRMFDAFGARLSTSGDLSKVREAMKHYMRDWSEEGAEERRTMFTPILDVLNEAPHAERSQRKVLVPGSGLGRLAWEISQLGYDTTANELSFFMTFAWRFLLSPATTQKRNQHTLHPYANWFSHQRTNSNLFRAVSFPDVVPRLGEHLQLLEQDFLQLKPPTSSPPSASGYDYIVTLFFIDTSLNVLATIEQIYALLRPGGTWINLGPLLWTGGTQARMELSLDEVLQLATMVGFEIAGEDKQTGDVRRRRAVECEYTADRRAMMRWLYQAEFWVATKTE